MSNFVLKIIAVVSMLVDHVGAIFISPSEYPYVFLVLRSIGRLALPIFLFLLVEGFYRTSNFRKYLTRMGIFALISEIPFDLALYEYHYATDFFSDFSAVFAGGYQDDKLGKLLSNLFSYQNVFVTLFFGLLLLNLMREVEKKYANNMAIVNLINGLLTIGFCLLTSLFRGDYSIASILMLVAFYLFRGNKLLIGVALFIVNGTIVGNLASDNLLYVIPVLSTLAIVPIAFYNGEKGKDIKLFFYIFYPLHLTLLFVISLFIR